MSQVRTSSTRSNVLWANYPLSSRRGTCVALSICNDQLYVALRGQGQISWELANKALSERELRNWIKTGFRGR